jgi:hypothetical protein
MPESVRPALRLAPKKTKKERSEVAAGKKTATERKKYFKKADEARHDASDFAA